MTSLTLLHLIISHDEKDHGCVQMSISKNTVHWVFFQNGVGAKPSGMCGSFMYTLENSEKSGKFSQRYTFQFKNGVCHSDTDFINPKGHKNCITGSKVTAILMKGWILPFGGVASGRVCACSLRSRLVN